MSTIAPRRSITKPLAEEAPRGRPALVSAFGSLLAALAAMVGALVIVVHIEPFLWHLLASLPLLVLGTVALQLFSDEIDRWLADDAEVRRAAGVVHWLSAATVALAIAVLAGILATSLFGYAPATGWAIVIDLVIGLSAGLLMVVVIAAVGSVLGWLLASVLRLLGAGEQRAGRFRAPFRSEWSWLELRRGLALGAVGLLLSAGASTLLGPARDTPSGAADTVPHQPTAWSTLGWPLLGWILGTGAVWVLFTRRRGGRISPRSGKQHAAHASALSVALLIVIAFSSGFVLDGYARGGLSAGTHRVPEVSLSQTSVTSSSALARSFAPTLELAPGEAWSPTSVAWYRAHATPDSRDQFCGGASPPGHCLRLGCDSSDPPAACAPSGRDLPALYYRYYAPADARAAHDTAPAPGHDWTVIQYWIFYNYDSLKTGIVTQWHQSDWEQVSVLVDRQETTVRPVEVAFSEHCYGAIVPAARVAWSGTHPISYVARGSHGNYPTGTDLPIRELQCLTRAEPEYLGVAGLFYNPNLGASSSALPLTYVINLRDHTGHTTTISEPEVIPAETTRSVIGFDGYWGLDNNLTVVAGRTRTGAGPRSPQKQNPWRKPFHDMFCAPNWLRVPSSATQWVCR